MSTVEAENQKQQPRSVTVRFDVYWWLLNAAMEAGDSVAEYLTYAVEYQMVSQEELATLSANPTLPFHDPNGDLQKRRRVAPIPLEILARIAKMSRALNVPEDNLIDFLVFKRIFPRFSKDHGLPK